MDIMEIKYIIKRIRNWRSLEIIRDLCIKRLEKEFNRKGVRRNNAI